MRHTDLVDTSSSLNALHHLVALDKRGSGDGYGFGG